MLSNDYGDVEAVPKEDLGELHHGDCVADAGGWGTARRLARAWAWQLPCPWRAAGRRGKRWTTDGGGAVESDSGLSLVGRLQEQRNHRATKGDEVGKKIKISMTCGVHWHTLTKQP